MFCKCFHLEEHWVETQGAGSREGQFMYVQSVAYGRYNLHLHFFVTTRSKIFLCAWRFMWEQEAARRRREPGIGLVGSRCPSLDLRAWRYAWTLHAGHLGCTAWLIQLHIKVVLYCDFSPRSGFLPRAGCLSWQPLQFCKKPSPSLAWNCCRKKGQVIWTEFPWAIVRLKIKTTNVLFSPRKKCWEYSLKIGVLSKLGMLATGWPWESGAELFNAFVTLAKLPSFL